MLIVDSILLGESYIIEILKYQKIDFTTDSFNKGCSYYRY